MSPQQSIIQEESSACDNTVDRENAKDLEQQELEELLMQLEIPVVKHNLAGSADVAAPVTMNMGYKQYQQSNYRFSVTSTIEQAEIVRKNDLQIQFLKKRKQMQLVKKKVSCLPFQVDKNMPSIQQPDKSQQIWKKQDNSVMTIRLSTQQSSLQSPVDRYKLKPQSMNNSTVLETDSRQPTKRRLFRSVRNSLDMSQSQHPCLNINADGHFQALQPHVMTPVSKASLRNQKELMTTATTRLPSALVQSDKNSQTNIQYKRGLHRKLKPVLQNQI